MKYSCIKYERNRVKNHLSVFRAKKQAKKFRFLLKNGTTPIPKRTFETKNKMGGDSIINLHKIPT